MNPSSPQAPDREEPTNPPPPAWANYAQPTPAWATPVKGNTFTRRRSYGGAGAVVAVLAVLCFGGGAYFFYAKDSNAGSSTPTQTTPASQPTSAQPVGETALLDPGVLGLQLRKSINTRLSNPDSPYYRPGIRAKDSVCVSDPQPREFDCVTQFSNGQSTTTVVVVSQDGSTFITK